MLGEKIHHIFRESRKTYGSPRVHQELRAQGFQAGKHRVARLMRKQGLQVVPCRRFVVTTESKHDDPVFPNVLNRQFTVAAPNQVWGSDLSAIWTDEGWLYIAIVLDLFSRQIVGWSIEKHLQSSLAVAALHMALSRRKVNAGLLHHSDRGVQYTCHEYQGELRKHGISCSMSRKGNCWDNAVVESFFRTLKVDLVYRRDYHDRATARREIAEYIEVFYNRQRRHSTLGYLSPVQFEQQALAA